VIPLKPQMMTITLQTQERMLKVMKLMKVLHNLELQVVPLRGLNLHQRGKSFFSRISRKNVLCLIFLLRQKDQWVSPKECGKKSFKTKWEFPTQNREEVLEKKLAKKLVLNLVLLNQNGNQVSMLRLKNQIVLK